MIADRNGRGKLVMESIVETKASGILQFIHSLRAARALKKQHAKALESSKLPPFVLYTLEAYHVDSAWGKRQRCLDVGPDCWPLQHSNFPALCSSLGCSTLSAR